MFNRKLKYRIEGLEDLLNAEKWTCEVQRDSKLSYMNAISTALMKNIITVDQCNQIMDLQAKYFDILRNNKKGA